MVQKLELVGVHVRIDARLRRYVVGKLGGLDKFMPRYGRDSAHLTVRLKEEKKNGRVRAVCEATLHLPRQAINLVASGANARMAVSGAAAKLRQRVKKYKDESPSGKKHRHIFGRLKRGVEERIPGM